MKEENYNFYMGVDLSKYIGEWIAISDKKIVSNGKNLKEVFKKTKSLKKKPLIIRVPDKEAMIF